MLDLRKAPRQTRKHTRARPGGRSSALPSDAERGGARRRPPDQSVKHKDAGKRIDPEARGIVCAVKRAAVIGAKELP
jgi:hypothetical protein